ncbi:MAG TPA: sensor histidine kinase, partial [Nitrospirota bacterium]
DTGPGIPKDESGRVFERYYRSPNVKGTRGTGLGLPIVKAVAEAHGGWVELDSEPGRGSKFSIFLPA